MATPKIYDRVSKNSVLNVYKYFKDEAMKDEAMKDEAMKFPPNHPQRSYVKKTAEAAGLPQRNQLELSASNTVKVDYRLPVTCSDFNSTTVNSLGLDFIDLLLVTLSISNRFLNVVSNTDFYAICSHYYHFSNIIVTNIILL